MKVTYADPAKAKAEFAKTEVAIAKATAAAKAFEKLCEATTTAATRIAGLSDADAITEGKKIAPKFPVPLDASLARAFLLGKLCDNLDAAATKVAAAAKAARLAADAADLAARPRRG